MSKNEKATSVPAVVQYRAQAPVGKIATMKQLLEANASNLAQVLPRHVTPERLVKTMLVAANRNPKILACTQASVIETINRAGELGLDLSGTLGEAYPVPFKNRLTLIIGYRGLAKLARQSGTVKRIEAEPVYERDVFRYSKGSNPVLEYVPHLKGERGKLVGFYALAEFPDGFWQADYMSVEEVEHTRQKAQSSDSPAWTDPQSYIEMGRKTVFRRLAKYLPLEGEKWEQALQVDNEDTEERAAQDDVITADYSMVDQLLTDEPPATTPQKPKEQPKERAKKKQEPKPKEEEQSQIAQDMEKIMPDEPRAEGDLLDEPAAEAGPPPPSEEDLDRLKAEMAELRAKGWLPGDWRTTFAGRWHVTSYDDVHMGNYDQIMSWIGQMRQRGEAKEAKR